MRPALALMRLASGLWPLASQSPHSRTLSLCCRLLLTQGYQLGPASLEFDITVIVDVPVPDDSAPSPSDGNTSDPSQPARYILQREALALSPAVKVASTSSNLVAVQLLGDLVTYTSLPVLR